MAFVVAQAGVFKPAVVSSSRNLRSSASQFRGNAVRAAVPVCRRRVAAIAARAEGASESFPSPDFINTVAEEFPDKMIASPYEAFVLLNKLGYKYLDVRPEIELELTSKYKGCTNVPYMNATYKYDAEQKKKVMNKTDNESFVDMVKKKFPDLSTPLLVGCSNGTVYSLDALGELDEAGYECLVGLKGGFYAYYKIFDANGRLRRGDGYTEDYSGQGETSCGIHGTGAGFERVDAIEKHSFPVY